MTNPSECDMIRNLNDEPINFDDDYINFKAIRELSQKWQNVNALVDERSLFLGKKVEEKRNALKQHKQ